MSTVKFLKKFGKYQPGDTLDVTTSKAYYWQKIGVAEPYFEHKEAVKSEAAPKAEKSASRSEPTEKATVSKKPEKVNIKKPPSKKRITKPGS